MSTICTRCDCDVIGDGPCEHVACLINDDHDLADPVAPIYTAQEYGGIDDEDFAGLHGVLVEFTERYAVGDEQWRAAAKDRAEKARDADVRRLLLATAGLIDNPDDDYDSVQAACWCLLGEEFIALLDRIFEAQPGAIEIDPWTVSQEFLSWSGTVYWGEPGTAAGIRSRINKIADGVRRLLKILPRD